MISVRNLTLRRGVNVVLDRASITFTPGEKIGLVGRTGAGKSSFFGLLNGTLHEDSGEFSIPGAWRMGQVAQEMPETEQSATDFVIEGDTVLLAAQAEVAAAEASDDGMRMAHAYMALHDAGAHDAPARAQALILGLGFSAAQLSQPVNSFSGGWRMRLQLARALMCPSDLLLLDEPTNHLDLDAIVWLEGWLAGYPGTLLLVSHDREFLDATVSTVVSFEARRLRRYGGDYSAFEAQRAERLANEQALYSRQQREIARLESFIDRFRAKATKARQAQSRLKELARMERIAPAHVDSPFDFHFQEFPGSPDPVIVLDEASCGYDGKAVLSVVNLTIQ